MRAVVEDYRTAPIAEADKQLFAFVEKLNLHPAEISAGDVALLQEAGWSDKAIFDAVTVCGLFNFFNRWVDGTGVPGMSERDYRASGIATPTGIKPLNADYRTKGLDPKYSARRL